MKIALSNINHSPAMSEERHGRRETVPFGNSPSNTTMYPTSEQVAAADRFQICSWWRFLPSPGESAIGKPEFQETLTREAVIMDQIAARFHAVGGFTPEISKALSP